MGLIALFAVLQSAPANLVADGTFTNINVQPSATAPPGLTTLYGQINSDPNYTGTIPSGTATGAILYATGWATKGYNFVYTPTTMDVGTQASGANSGQPLQAPGQATVTVSGNKYGNTFMWGTNNGGNNAITAPPGGGNILAADGAYETGAINQVVSGLTVNQTYALTFYYAAAQQQAYTGNTTETWTVSLGTGTTPPSGTTPTINLGSEDFSGWFQATMYFQASATTETLSFLASGTPTGEPPFSLLADVDLEVVPDYSNWAVFGGFGALCVGFEVMRRRRRRAFRGAMTLDKELVCARV